MKCKKCKSELIERDGKFGKFLACPKSNPSDNHGTVSVYKKLLSVRTSSGVIVDYDLMHQIKTQTHQFGWGYDDLAQTCEWIVDNPDEEEDHWMDVREY